MIGSLAALLASVCWAVAPIIGAKAARELGTLKFARARLLSAACIVSAFAIARAEWTTLSWTSCMYLFLSSLIGVAIGDTALFHSLKLLGPRLSSLLYSLNVPISAALAYLFLNETIGPRQLIGFTLTFSGVLMAVAFGQVTAKNRKPVQIFTANPKTLMGIAAGIVAASCQAGGLILAKPAFGLGVDVITAVSFRLVVAALCLNIPAFISGTFLSQFQQIRGELLVRTFGSAAIGTGLGICFLMFALSKSNASEVGLLSSLAPLFMLPLIVVFRGERPHLLAWVGTLASSAGLAFLLLK